MIDVLRSTEVPVPPCGVWAVLGDFGAISGWAVNVDHSCLITDQSEGVGTVRRIQAGRAVVLERVDTWEPPSILTYSLEGLPPIVRSATNTWVIEAAPAGSRVWLISRVDAGPRVVAAAVAQRLARASEVLLAGLREECS